MQKNRTGKKNGDTVEAADMYVFRLYITGASPNSMRAIMNTKRICEQHLPEKYDLEIIDVHQQPEIAKHENIIALPMLIKKHPKPETRMIGDLSDTKRVLNRIGLINDED